MNRATRRRGGGFSLIELLVALSLTGMVMALAVGALVQGMKNERLGRIRAELAREGAFATAVLTQSLRQTGLGVPTGGHILSGETHTYAVIAGTSNTVGVVADLPRPHRQYNTFGALYGRAPTNNCTTPAANRRYLAWHTANNGACMPGTGALDCNPEETSIFFPGDSTAAFCEANATDRMCPWGVGRLNPSERFQIASGGSWTGATFPAAPTISNRNGTFYLDLTAISPYDDIATANWPNCTGNPPHELNGARFVTTLDRMFFRFAGAGPYTLERKQCWGDPEPFDTNWPSSGNAVNALSTVNGTTVCEPAADAAWETLLTDISSFTLTFLDGGTTATAPAALAVPLSEADKAAVRRIDFTFTLSKTRDGRTATQDFVGSVAIRNPLVP